MLPIYKLRAHAVISKGLDELESVSVRKLDVATTRLQELTHEHLVELRGDSHACKILGAHGLDVCDGIVLAETIVKSSKVPNKVWSLTVCSIFVPPHMSNSHVLHYVFACN